MMGSLGAGVRGRRGMVCVTLIVVKVDVVVEY